MLRGMRGSSHPPLRIIRRISMRRGGLGWRRLGLMPMGAGGDILFRIFLFVAIFYIFYNIFCIIYLIYLLNTNIYIYAYFVIFNFIV